MNKFSSEISNMNSTRTMYSPMSMCMCMYLIFQEDDKI